MEEPQLDLHAACRAGDLTLIEKCLKLPEQDVNRRGKDNKTPIMLAAEMGHEDVFDLLLENGSNLFYEDTHSNNILHLACVGGSVDIVDALLSKEEDWVNSIGDGGKTPIMVAAEHAHKEVFYLLLRRGSDVSKTDRFGNFLIHWACEGGNEDIVETIIRQKLFDIDVKGRNGMTAAMAAASSGQGHIFDVLVNYSCKTSSFDDEGNGLLHHGAKGGNMQIVEYLLTKQTIYVNRVNSKGVSPVMAAASCGHRSVFFLMVNKGCHFAGRTKLGNNALHLACLSGCVEIVDFLATKVDINSRGRHRMTAAMFAAAQGYKNILDVLVGKGANLRCSDSYHDHVLHHAVRGGNVAIVEYLLSMRIIDINARGKNGLTPAMIAAEKGMRDIFYLLVSQGCDLDGNTSRGDCILHSACMGGNVELVEYVLVQNSVDINQRGQHHATPIMVAAQNGNDVVFDHLINRGCDLNLVDLNHDTLLHHACIGGSSRVFEYLIAKKSFDINKRGQHGMTPAMMAVHTGHNHIFRRLADENCDMQLRSERRLNLLHIACLSGNAEVAEYIVCNNIIDSSSRGGVSETTPVMMAAQRGHKVIFDLLVREGCQLKTVDRDSNNILHMACVGGNVDIVDYILSRDIVTMDSRGYNFQTPVMMAAESNHKDVFDFLLRRGCDMSLVDNKRNTILHAACVGGNVDIARYILSQKIVNINSKNEEGKTAVMLAIESGHTHLANFLISRGSKTPCKVS